MNLILDLVLFASGFLLGYLLGSGRRRKKPAAGAVTLGATLGKPQEKP